MIRDGRLVARKLGRKTLIDGAALESCWKGLPLVEGPAPINSPRQNFLQARWRTPTLLDDADAKFDEVALLLLRPF
jgi:hypothetical protein